MKFTLDAKRAGLLALILVVIVFCIEGTLTLLRKRDVSASISVMSQRPTRTPTPIGAGIPLSATPDPLASPRSDP